MTAKVYRMHPLRPDQLERLLRAQWDANASSARVSRQAFDSAISRYMQDIKAQAASVEEASQTLTLLCNPMDAALAAELFALGKTPEPFHLVAQRFALASELFMEQQRREFPSERFAERVFEWRESGAPDLDVSGFEAEVEILVQHKLMLRRTDTVKTRNEPTTATRWMFRHEKIMDFLLTPAFSGEHEARRAAKLGDQRFHGVYEVLAHQVSLAEAEQVQRLLLDWAAEHNQNDLLNRVTRILNARRAPVHAAPASGVVPKPAAETPEAVRVKTS